MQAVVGNCRYIMNKCRCPHSLTGAVFRPLCHRQRLASGIKPHRRALGRGEWLTAVAPSCPTHCATACWENGPYDAAKRPVLHCHTACFTRQNGVCRLFKKTRTRQRKPPLLLPRDKVAAHGLRAARLQEPKANCHPQHAPFRGWAFAIALPTVWAICKAAAWHGHTRLGV